MYSTVLYICTCICLHTFCWLQLIAGCRLRARFDSAQREAEEGADDYGAGRVQLDVSANREHVRFVNVAEELPAATQSDATDGGAASSPHWQQAPRPSYSKRKSVGHDASPAARFLASTCSYFRHTRT